MASPEPKVTLYADLNDRRSVQQKRVLAKALVEACSEALEVPPAHIAVRFRIFTYEDMARGGVLLADIERR